MSTFIENVLQELKEKHTDFTSVVFILPSKRAGIFLKSKLADFITQTNFAPEIKSIENFVEDLSELQQISGIELLFQFYKSYKTITSENKTEPFDSFAKWAQIIIQDFNEIDRYLIPPDEIFDYLSAIQEINHWSVAEQKTTMVTNYLSFWKNLKNYYKNFRNDLLKQNLAYQGLIYREATKQIETYLNNSQKKHVFLGFNALNTSEQLIIQTVLNLGSGMVFWDADHHFIENKIHSAGLFIRQHIKTWPFYQKNSFNWINSYYIKQKKIKVIGCSKSVGQSKYVGNLLKQLAKDKNTIANTAVVLGDETLLTPVLNALPESIGAVNVTMGLPLKSIPLSTLFEQLFAMHKLPNNKFYYKDVLSILLNQMVQHTLKSGKDIIHSIQINNSVFLDLDDILTLSDVSDKTLLHLLFGNWHASINKTIDYCIAIIHNIKSAFKSEKSQNKLELEYLYRFNTLFNEIATLSNKHDYITDVSILFSVYKELLASETLDFQGEPLEGLQIMGMLESRVLDFETVIITSVNEGILPGGKTNNSFIPFDVKIEKGLPTFKEKDAVYTYHFYNLIQRAKHVYIIYNTEVDALKGGEKSRFITQLDVEKVHNVEHYSVSPNVPNLETQLNSISKTAQVIEDLKLVAKKGFSPSSLTNYIRNPLDFYFERILGVKNIDEVEETVASNTLGSVIHNTLEDFYKPLEGKFLKVEDLQKMKLSTDKVITKHFKTIYKNGDITTGKNLITSEIAKRYVNNFINSEIDLITKGNTIKIIAIEVENSIELSIPELPFLIHLKGKVDRVDELNGMTRVIDYKSGKVEQNQIEIVDWEDINTDYTKYSKSFQVLCYAYMMHKQNVINLPVEAGIISFKNNKGGFLKFGKKESPKSRNKNQLITEDSINAFENQLKNLILEICNPDVNFIEKELN